MTVWPFFFDFFYYFCVCCFYFPFRNFCFENLEDHDSSTISTPKKGHVGRQVKGGHEDEVGNEFGYVARHPPVEGPSILTVEVT